MTLGDALHGAVLLVAAIAVAAMCRWIFTQSRALGWIVTLGLGVRLTAGVAAFLISYLNLPLFSRLHTGDGFWVLAGDARVYFDLARRASEVSLDVPDGAPSPLFLEALGLWFRGTGASLINAVLFNALCYVCTAMVIVSYGRRVANHEWLTRAGGLVLCAFSFSPIIVLTSTQALKDPLFVFLIAAACIGALLTLEALSWARPKPVPVLAIGAAVLCASVYGIGGIRAYYSVMVISASTLR